MLRYRSISSLKNYRTIVGSKSLKFLFMDANTLFIIDHLEKKSNAILGFLVVQSIYLA